MPDRPTRAQSYTTRLVSRELRRWKQLLDVQRPYRQHIRGLDLGRTLDVGCGIGRNLRSLEDGSIGVDHNPTSVAHARSRGLTAYTPEEFRASPQSARPFDALLVAHVLEHLAPDAAASLLADYLPYLRTGGRAVLICPQEAGFRSDGTHVHFLDGSELTELASAVGLHPVRCYSFPFPRPVGRLFTHNESVVIATKPTGSP